MKWFVLDINPEPWRIGPVGVARRNGKLVGFVGRDQQLDAYKEAVRDEIGSDHELIEGCVRLVLFFWRRRDQYETPQAKMHRKHEADVTNMAKATEDALQDVLFKNDKDTNDIRGVLVEQGPNVIPRIVIGIESSPDIPVGATGLIPDEIWREMERRDRSYYKTLHPSRLTWNGPSK
jgi:Holliday junction resolvase RusA-like endonuclease